ncbi:MAG: MurR/RpiR family transcriptional regulator [Desulfamplus sp.]|nr:MurR/RpiR family transcriptional regulator [Desulfamplus sp.]
MTNSISFPPTDVATSHPAVVDIISRLDSLTPKAKILGSYIIQNPGKVVLMTTRQLAKVCGISEATVVRFAMFLGYSGYSDLQRALKDLIYTKSSLGKNLDVNIGSDKLGEDCTSEIASQDSGRTLLYRVFFEELSELQFFYETVNVKIMSQFINYIIQSPAVYLVGSRISYTSAYYMGWSLTKVRRGIHILKGSDSTAIDNLSVAPDGSLVVMVATARYPNELIKLSKLTKRLGHKLLVLTDSQLSPLLAFATLSLVVPTKSMQSIDKNPISFTGNPSNMLCAIKYIVQEVAAGQGEALKEHQQRVEQVYLENDIMFNLQS